MTDWTITQARMMIDPAVPVDERNNFLLFPLPNTATLLLLHRFWSRMHDDTHGQSFLVSVKRSCQNTDAEDVNKERAQESPCCGDAVKTPGTLHEQKRGCRKCVCSCHASRVHSVFLRGKKKDFGF
jgi:hypothetical protein